MTPPEIMSLVGVSLAIVTTLLGGLMWVVKAQVQAMRKDLLPNGGTSTKDQLNRIESDIREVRTKLTTTSLGILTTNSTAKNHSHSTSGWLF
jgi:hypothetical protein